MSVGVRGIYPGFDFESGQMRIEPMEPICKRGRAKDDPVAMNVFAFSSPRKFYSCPMCEETVKKGRPLLPKVRAAFNFRSPKRTFRFLQIRHKAAQSEVLQFEIYKFRKELIPILVNQVRVRFISIR